MAKKVRIVIIGAGMAGLTAANKLYTTSNNHFELSVVEGGSRIGGRINTSEFSGEKIEMGATWIHGIGGSPVYKIAEETGSLVSNQPWEWMDSGIDKPRTFSEGGFEIEPEIVESVTGLFNSLMELAQGKEISQIDGDLTRFANIYEIATRVSSSRSVGAFLKSGFDAYWESEHNQEDERIGKWSRKSIEESIFEMLSNTQRTYTSADDLSTLDFSAESEYQMFPGEEITIAKGYLSVINHLANVLPRDLIQLNRRVVKIEWQNNEEQEKIENGFDDNPPVKLHFSDGSILFADHVIVTVSLGVLKSGIQEGLFNPCLPDFKSEAISRLGYGVVNKLFVEMSQRNFPSLQLVFNNQKDSEYFRVTKIPWWMRRTATIAPIHNNSKVLLSWFAGKEALELENLTDEEIKDGVMTTISCLTGKELQKLSADNNGDVNGGITNDFDECKGVKLGKVLRSKWGKDPLFRGSYSYVAVGSSGEDLDAMAEPLPKLKGEVKVKVKELQVMFAGEATHRTHYSTTHGAYFSGLREANRILKHYKLCF